MTRPPHLRSGKQAEDIACRWLIRNGLQLIARNYYCRGGELDLILSDGECLVVAEVRYRASSDYGGASGSVNSGKQRRIARATCRFLADNPQLEELPLRFDVIALSGNLNSPTIRWYRHAFLFNEPC